MTDKWGPPTWNFLHTIAEKIKDEEYPRIGTELVNYIVRIINYLPCPDCSKHASDYINKRVPPYKFQTKEGLKEVLYYLHNYVNTRTNKPTPGIEILNRYKQKYTANDVVNTFNMFARVYNTKGNMNFIMESYHRNRLMNELKQWIMLNIKSFSE